MIFKVKDIYENKIDSIYFFEDKINEIKLSKFFFDKIIYISKIKS